LSGPALDASLAPAGEFPSLDDICYMNTASIGLMSRSALAEEEKFQRQLGLYGTTWFDEPTEVGVLEQARREGAALLGAPAEQVAVTTSVTEALSQVAWSLRPESGSNVVSIDLEFPTVTYPWMRVARDTGAEVRLISAAGDPAKLSFEGLAEAVDQRTAAISVSHVQYSTGFRYQLEELSELAETNGALLVVDASQSLGAVPIDLSSVRIDALLCAGYKWLCGPFGAALCYVGERLLERLDPPFVGWKSAADPWSLHASSLRLASSVVERLEYATMAYAAGVALAAAIRQISVIGADRILEHNLKLASTLTEGLEHLGAEVITPREDERRSGIVTARFPARDGEQVAAWMNQSGVIVSPRFGSTRFSIHFFNGSDDVSFALDTLERVLATGGPVARDRHTK
jgi:cysteine desulfurase / selenocysteine lyase